MHLHTHNYVYHKLIMTHITFLAQMLLDIYNSLFDDELNSSLAFNHEAVVSFDVLNKFAMITLYNMQYAKKNWILTFIRHVMYLYTVCSSESAEYLGKIDWRSSS